MLNRLLLLALFIVLVLEPTRLVPLAILPGLSTKNLLIYLTVIVLGLQAALTPSGLRFRDVDVHLAFLALILYAFVSWAVLSAFEPTYSSWRGFIALKAQFIDYYLLVLIYRYGVGSLDDALGMLRTAVLILLLANVIGAIDYLADLGLFRVGQGRSTGFIGEANQYGALLAFLLPLAVVMAMSERRGRWLWWLLVAAAAFMVIATGSRGTWVGIFMGPLVAAWYLRRHVDFLTVLKFWITAAATISVLALVAVAAFDMDFILERVSLLFEGHSSGRTDIWLAMLRVMLEWPLSFAVGYGWFTYASFGIWKAAHSEYLGLLFELGAVGVILFLTLMAVIASRTRASLRAMSSGLARLELGYLFGLVSLMITIVFVDIPTTWPYVWVVTGLIFGLQAYSPSADAVAKDAPITAPQGPPAAHGPVPDRRPAAPPAWVSNTRPS